MAIIAVNTYLDGGTARTAGEAWTINSGATFTIRTDTRVHANAPASFTGSLGSITVSEGKVIWDSRNVRVVPYNSGTGNVPAIGTTVTQGGVSGYFLGAYASWAVQATAAGSAMPTSGWLKFRELSGGEFAAGALSGIGASATGASRQGWISIVCDAGANLSFPRLGLHQARGDKFFLDTTTGTRGQVFQVPSEGSTAMIAPGLMVETGVGTDTYEFWPALNGATNGWTHIHVGNATGTTDARQKYVKSVAGGTMVMGETWSASATYASLAAQVGTYAEVSQSSMYTWANNVVEVYNATAHGLVTGQQTGLDFTSGGATAYDGIYTVTVLDPYRFTVPLTGSGVSGNVTSKPGVTITFTAHTLNVGDSVYCDFTSGTGVDGTYEIYAVGSANAYTIKYPHVAAITSGNVSCLHTLVITSTDHGLGVGQTVYCDFTSGTGVDGVYVGRVIAANTINVTFPHTATTSGNVTISRDIGYVAPAGRRTWIPSNILNECATAARATNTIPNATIATRPKWTTTSAGAIDLEYVYGCSGYMNSLQAYSLRLRNVVLPDHVAVSELATPIDIDGLYVGMTSALDLQTISFANNYAGGIAKNMTAHRANTPGASDHAFTLTYCNNITLDNVSAAIVQYARSTGYGIVLSSCSGITIQNSNTRNTRIEALGSPSTIIKNYDYCERINGKGSAVMLAVVFGTNSHNSVVDGVTVGIGGMIDNCHPYAFVNYAGCTNVKVRNIGTYTTPVNIPAWAPNLATPFYIAYSSGACNTVKNQRCYVAGTRSAWFSSSNADKNFLYESIYGGMYAYATLGVSLLAHAELNGVTKGCQEMPTVTGQASVYGTHFIDTFCGTDYGRYVLYCNEVSAETAAQFQNVVGTAKFNSTGGVIVQNVGDQCVFTDADFRKGHEGFEKCEIAMSGGTITNYNLHYQIDTGSGFGGWQNLYYQRSGAVGTSGQYTFTVTDATGVAVGDYCFGTGMSTVGLYTKNAIIPKVTNVVGNTITVDVANTATVSGIIRFCHLPSEVITPSIGFKMKVRVTTLLTATAAITFLTMRTLTSSASQIQVTYPLDMITLTLSGLVSGSDVVILQAGTETILATQEDINASSYAYVYEIATTVDIRVYKPGYLPFAIVNYALGSTNASLPIVQVPDVSYLD